MYLFPKLLYKNALAGLVLEVQFFFVLLLALVTMGG